VPRWSSPIRRSEEGDRDAIDARNGLWAFESFLAVGDDPADRVTLGEGMTPLVDADAKADGDDSPDADDWNAAFKLEYVFPTGSFKDRGATTTLTRARELGVERVVEDSPATPAPRSRRTPRAGIDAAVYVPADVKDSKLRAIRRAGAEPVRIEGSRADVTEACVAARLGGRRGWRGGRGGRGRTKRRFRRLRVVRQPRVESGVLRGDRHRRLRDRVPARLGGPDAVVTPLGHGTLFLGAYRGSVG